VAPKRPSGVTTGPTVVADALYVLPSVIPSGEGAAAGYEWFPPGGHLCHFWLIGIRKNLLRV
jgi:hypothetical protein